MSPNPTSLAGAPLPPQIAAPVSELLPPDIAPAGAQPPDIIFTLPADHASEETLRIIRIGHSSVMVQWGHDTLLTDPWFSQKRSHPGYYPGESLAMGIDALPKLTGVLGSMDHWDHFDMEHFAAYRDHGVPIIVPAGTTQRDQALEAGFSDVRALSPWGTVDLGAFRVTAVCAKPDQPTISFECAGSAPALLFPSTGPSPSSSRSRSRADLPTQSLAPTASLRAAVRLVQALSAPVHAASLPWGPFS